MRKLAQGRIFAERLRTVAETHPFYEAALLLAEIRADEERARNEGRAWKERCARDRLARFPGPGREYVVASAYEMHDDPAGPPLALAMQAVYAQSEGSWMTRHWLLARPDGTLIRVGLLARAADRLRYILDVETAARRRAALDAPARVY